MQVILDNSTKVISIDKNQANLFLGDIKNEK